jgi:hypothetical protein
MNWLVQRGSISENQVVKMVVIVLAKVIKMSWFDHPEL